ncbi:aminodeoxychorismate/anthranilate synthase component II [Neobacillus sp. PS3-40]|uniref:anthranilate synthase component II n=1 Tax=Neobacillus sp. PS3-40 TaxID=3070679 RepID=UPI0027E10231|nr:aminodeoxychorismate/anthranilate synthase component II [Neobacillus sp. PS3-40]WML44959.1 aminodeoxychorismate/anthranilate synthase component II [Neobacillus sp. PS3-40]
MILLIDNFDSFTYNLYQFLGDLGEDVLVERNNQLSMEQINKWKPSAIILSPGPGKPENAGVCVEVIRTFFKAIPILGICLGHQAIGYAFGAEIVPAKIIKHGKTSLITHNCKGLFKNLSTPLEVMRYHSLAIEKNNLPIELECTARSMDDQEIMAIKHNVFPVYGLQFHPESIGTPSGKQILENFLVQLEGKRENEEFFTPVS